ncbi:ATP-binding cassette domain-containing protein [Arthrobacter sp. AL12]|uniref:ABC transporter ATP-binding protein n=1 Tax=Arthrobacter sp. AL12 TaxID=3042241 RepID=UPI00249ACCDB|nr:ATP-binding cassette domain-containing protein [Arthrobacter sp. AL12]MDI3213358.1 ATP-binding cassette domain-containing protein [Arthrobacter sp. AL12]
MTATDPTTAAAATASTAVLAARIGSFSFHGERTPALRDIDLSVRPGVLTAVLGGSGSGKTTLGKLLAGWHRPGQSGTFTGSLTLAGQPLEFRGLEDDPRINPSAWSTRVGYVPQDAAAMLSTVRSTVAEELAFGLENRGTPRRDMLRAVARAAEQTGLTALLDRDPATLSGGELRRLAMACAVVQDPWVLVLDEPLASLDAAGIIQVRDLINRLTGAGTGVVLLSQSADGLARSAGHWIILDGGTATASGIPRELIRSAELARTGTLLPAVTHAVPAVRGRAPEPEAAPVLELFGLGFGYPGTGDADGEPLLRDLELTVRPGEIVAITGPNGAGKSTLLRHLNGLLRPHTGEVRIQGRSIAGIPTGRIAASVGLLFQHPRDQLFERTVLREASFGLRRLHGRDAAARADEALEAVGLAGAARTHPAELPASQQRLLALATVLARGPAVLALDEPTVGLDRHGLDRLDRAVAAAAARGAAVVLVTHDAAYARATAHRVLALDGGSLREG